MSRTSLKRDSLKSDSTRRLRGLRTVFLGSVRSEHPSELTRGRLENAGDLGRRSLQEAENLGPERIERGQRGESLDASDVQRVLTQRTADDGQLLVVLGEGGNHLRRSDRILGVGDGGRALEQGTERREGRALEGPQREPVLCDLVAGAGCPDLSTQVRHFLDGET